MFKRLHRTQLRPWVLKRHKEQGGVCPLCLTGIDLSIPKEGVADHNHETGELRGVLHRSCNAAEGKVLMAVLRWGTKSNLYADAIPFLERLIEYLKNAQSGCMYPTHKTLEEREVLKRKRRAVQQRKRRVLKVVQ